MKIFYIMTLMFNFFKCALLSAWQTAHIIVMKSGKVSSGMVELPYEELSPAQASLVGAMITLAPGTTTVNIDIKDQTFTLHLLDLDSETETLQSIEKDFIAPIRRYNGVSA